MSLRSQRFHVNFSEFIRETADFWVCHFLLMQSKKGSPAKGWREPSTVQHWKHKLWHKTSAVISAPNTMLKAAFITWSSSRKGHSPLHAEAAPFPATHKAAHRGLHEALLFSKTTRQEVPATTDSPWRWAGPDTCMACHKLASPRPGITQISNLASTVLELSPARGEKDRRQRFNSPAQAEKKKSKKATSAIYRSHQDFNFFFPSFFFLFPLWL